MIWTAGTLMDHTQELLGDSVGGFYNISSRLAQMNAAQRNLTEATRALSAIHQDTTVADTRTYYLPDDMLTFDQQAPYLLKNGEHRGNLKVVAVSKMDVSFPGWQDTTSRGTPTHLTVRGTQYDLWPIPDGAYTIYLPYTVTPDLMTNRDSLPFNGEERLNRFAPALAYAVARTIYLSRAPTLARYMDEEYRRIEREMRHYLRTNPQTTPHLNVPAYRSR